LHEHDESHEHVHGVAQARDRAPLVALDRAQQEPQRELPGEGEGDRGGEPEGGEGPGGGRADGRVHEEAGGGHNSRRPLERRPEGDGPPGEDARLFEDVLGEEDPGVDTVARGGHEDRHLSQRPVRAGREGPERLRWDRLVHRRGPRSGLG
jgi:hypothetical protein